MSSFDDIKKSIKKDIEMRQENPESEGALDTPTTPVDKKGMPAPQPTGTIGTVISKPGTEQIMLNASTFQLMVCEAVAKRGKQRYCVIEKGVNAKYGNQFINAAGERAHVVTKEVFNLFHGVLNTLAKQLLKTNDALELANERVSLQKMTLDALKKNGIID